MVRFGLFPQCHKCFLGWIWTRFLLGTGQWRTYHKAELIAYRKWWIQFDVSSRIFSYVNMTVYTTSSLFCFFFLYNRVYASNQFQRDESVTFGNNRDYTINEYINFEAEDQLKYVIIIDIKNGDYNVTIDSFPFTRIPPAALKSLVG